MRRLIGGQQVWVGIPSNRRSRNVETAEALLGPVTWYTHEGQRDAYCDAGATACCECGPWPSNRNAILDEAHVRGLIAVMVDDDVNGFALASHRRLTPASFEEAVGVMVERLAAEPGAYLAGVSPYRHARPTTPGWPVARTSVIWGSVMVVKPSGLRFDERIVLREDMDFTCQHLERFGEVMRCDDVIARIGPRSPEGGNPLGAGCTPHRTPEISLAVNRLLVEKWGSVIVANQSLTVVRDVRWANRV